VTDIQRGAFPGASRLIVTSVSLPTTRIPHIVTGDFSDKVNTTLSGLDNWLQIPGSWDGFETTFDWLRILRTERKHQAVDSFPALFELKRLRCGINTDSVGGTLPFIPGKQLLFLS
jgi:hypothetical protein